MRIIPFGLLSCCVGFAASISLSPDLPIQTTAPGTFVTFTGTITDIGSDDVFLNGFSVSLPYFELNYDLTPFFNQSPPSLSAGDSYVGDLFTVSVSSAALPGDYFGSFSIQGGADSSTFDDLADQSFQVTVSNVPEPSSVLVPILCLLLLGVTRGCTLYPGGFKDVLPREIVERPTGRIVGFYLGLSEFLFKTSATIPSSPVTAKERINSIPGPIASSPGYCCPLRPMKSASSHRKMPRLTIKVASTKRRTKIFRDCHMYVMLRCF